MSGVTPALPELVEAAIAGDRRATGRLLTLTERGGADADRIAELTHVPAQDAHIIGITGAPGAGKSTMVASLVEAMAAHGSRPAVLAVDPSSPLTGGAILGDRVRMAAVDTSAFIRSMATRGHAGGLALAIPGGCRVLGATGHDPVIIETVGVGQVEVDVSAAADTTVVVVTPGMGDAVQANKAGLLEVADIFVVNKADRPGADDARRDLELMQELSHVTGQEDQHYRPPILMVDSLAGTGIEAVREAIVAHRAHLVTVGGLRARRRARVRFEISTRIELATSARLRAALDHGRGQDWVTRVVDGDATPGAAADALVKELLPRRV